MKELILTSISQETSIQNPEDSFFLLVFNGGALRVPTNPEGIRDIMDYLLPDEEVPEQEPKYPPGVEVFGSESTVESTHWGKAHDNDETDVDPVEEEPEDDDGEYDINDGVGSI